MSFAILYLVVRMTIRCPPRRPPQHPRFKPATSRIPLLPRYLLPRHGHVMHPLWKRRSRGELPRTLPYTEPPTDTTDIRRYCTSPRIPPCKLLHGPAAGNAARA
ncbi:hypothetical protein B0H12DRAFT_1138619 [Mycena haematopus]|nr:hypothetical protein B0H12DRAFT_1138619 [Mycena haematopus]